MLSYFSTSTILYIVGSLAVGYLARVAHAKASSAGTIDLYGPAHAAGLDALLPLLQAIEGGSSQSQILDEARKLSKLVDQYGGIAPLLHGAFNQILEQRLADPATKAPLLSKIAAAFGVSPRDLLDAVEGKSAATPAPAPAATSAAAPVLIGLALLFGMSGSVMAAGPSHWHADVIAPQRFYAADETPVIDEPLFVQCQAPACAVPRQDALPPRAAAPVHAIQPVRRAVRAPFRVFGWLFHRGC